jgi:hypothetical protein
MSVTRYRCEICATLFKKQFPWPDPANDGELFMGDHGAACRQCIERYGAEPAPIQLAPNILARNQQAAELVGMGKLDYITHPSINFTYALHLPFRQYSWLGNLADDEGYMSSTVVLMSEDGKIEIATIPQLCTPIAWLRLRKALEPAYLPKN